jgi:hypothetical protein
VYSSEGKVLQEHIINQNTLKIKKLNLSDFPGGVYYLQLSSEAKTSAKKIILIN